MKATAQTLRQTAKATLFTRLYGLLELSVYDFQPSLLFGDADSILCLLADELPSYRGKLTEQAFSRWAAKFIEKTAKRYADTATILEANRPYIRAAIRRTMPYGIFDNALSMSDLENEIAIRVFADVESLADNPEKHTAKQSTRVYGMAKKHLEYYVTSKMRDRFNLILARVSQGQTPYGDVEASSRILKQHDLHGPGQVREAQP
jgi:hypothetical protein